MRDLIKVGCVALVFSLSLAAPVAAGPFEDARAAYHRGDYPTALRLFRGLANQGGAAAQYNLGYIYWTGVGVPQDYAEAMQWYRKAADQEHPGALLTLGHMYEFGQGVPTDYVQAHKWYNLGTARIPVSEPERREAAVAMRDNAAKRLTAAPIAEAQQLAREWKPK